ncbi:MAG: M48 family metalloprotease [Holophagaceae bacterium]
MKVPACLALAGLLALLGCQEVQSQNQVTGRKQFVAMTPAEEVKVGRESAPEVIKQLGGLDPSPRAQAFVAEVGRKVVARSGAAASGYPFEFRVLADPKTVNAMALPGGQVFITRGLLDKLDNEAQLAGVLGHEVGHVVARHASQHLAKAQAANVGLAILAILTTDKEKPDQPNRAVSVAAVGAQLLTLKYGREDELESDSLGVRFMAEAGYDPRAMEGVMAVLRKLGGQRQLEWLSTHPDPGNREERIRGLIAGRFPKGVPAAATLGARPLPVR